jgi:hypothetical protein
VPPVTIKNNQWIDGLWLSQWLLLFVFVNGCLFVTWPWSLFSLLILPFILCNQRTISQNKNREIYVNKQSQWFCRLAEDVMACRVGDYWHMGGWLWLRLESDRFQHHCLIIKNRMGGVGYAQLLIAVNQNEQKTE